MHGKVTPLLLIQCFEQSAFVQQLSRTLGCQTVHARPLKRFDVLLMLVSCLGTNKRNPLIVAEANNIVCIVHHIQPVLQKKSQVGRSQSSYPVRWRPLSGNLLEDDLAKRRWRNNCGFHCRRPPGCGVPTRPQIKFSPNRRITFHGVFFALQQLSAARMA
jgi:hypothetical protein